MNESEKEIEKAEKYIASGELTPKQVTEVQALIYRLLKGSREKIKDLNLIRFSKG